MSMWIIIVMGGWGGLVLSDVYINIIFIYIICI